MLPEKTSGAITPVDWDHIRRQVEAARVEVEQGSKMDVEKKRAILRARARALARKSHEEETIEESINVVTFLLAYEQYGVESSFVREVYPVKELTPLPCTPSFVYGFINVRGQILSVIDIKKFFDLPERGLTDLNKVIILRNAAMEFGILADAVLGVRTIALRELQPPLPTLTGIREEYLRGITQDRTVVLDALKLLSDNKIVIHQEVEKT